MTSAPLFYDRRGDRIGLDEWLAKREDPEYCAVARDVVGRVVVSTVWLGMAGCVYETALMLDADVAIADRYDDEAAALRGHEAVVAAQVLAQRDRG